MSSADMIVVTTPTVPGYEVAKVIGPVHGLTVRTRGIAGKFGAAIRA